MNLNAYDNVKEKIDKSKTWINIKTKTIISREFNIHKYVTLTKRYDSKTNTNSYYVVLVNIPPIDKDSSLLKVDDYGRCKIKVSSIWNCSNLCQLEHDCNIMTKHVEHDDDGDIYLLDI